MNTQTQHTPGPWKLGVSTTTLCSTHKRVVADSGAFICRIEGADFSREDDVANARLIAAAPELLEALVAAQELIKVARRRFPKTLRNGDTWLLESTNAAIGSAIHKATGN
jgi:hypothetical protein